MIKKQIAKKDKDFSYNRMYEYFIKRFEDINALGKKDYLYFKNKKTILNTKIKEYDKLMLACIVHTNNLNDDENHINVHFKYVTLRELEKVCKKYYLVKERREPVIVEMEYMFDEVSRNKLKEEYE